MKRIELKQLTFESIGVMEPRLNLLLERALMVVAQDCMDRPGDKTVRKVMIEIAVDPVADRDNAGECDHVNLCVDVKWKLPTYKSAVFQLEPTKRGLLFNAEIPESLDQHALDFGTKEDE